MSCVDQFCRRKLDLAHHAKGQLISKCIFGVFNSSKKNELENFNFCPSLMGQKFFVRFLEEMKTPKRLFEIN
jgi:hypothetical protein